uniref:Uncharacterized protein n=1 Tax=Ciona intestinalis TaxID=7719 RepID=H2XYK6_CIOIN
MRRVAPPSDVVLTSQAFINTWTHPVRNDYRIVLYQHGRNSHGYEHN